MKHNWHMVRIHWLWLFLLVFLAACDLLRPSPVVPSPTPLAPLVTPEPFRGTPKAGSVTPTLAKTLTPGRYRIQPLSAPAPFAAQAGSPRYIPNFASLDKGCNWLGVAGQVFELNQQPLINMVVVVAGKLSGVTIDAIGLTGLNPEYGPGGYEIVLADKVINSSESLKIQVFDLAGTPQTEPIVVNTVADCQKNLVIFNFMRYPGPFRYYYPWIGR